MPQGTSYDPVAPAPGPHDLAAADPGTSCDPVAPAPGPYDLAADDPATSCDPVAPAPGSYDLAAADETHAWTMNLCRPSMSFIGRPMNLHGAGRTASNSTPPEVSSRVARPWATSSSRCALVSIDAMPWANGSSSS